MRTCAKLFIAGMALAAPVAANAMTIQADITGFNLADPDWAVLGIAPVSTATLQVTFDETSPSSTSTVGAPNYLTDIAFFAITDFRLDFGSLTLDGFASSPDGSVAYIRDSHSVVSGPPLSDYASFDIYEDRLLSGGIVFDAFHVQMSNSAADYDLLSGIDFSDLATLNAMQYQSAYIRFYLAENPGQILAISSNGTGNITLSNITAVPLPAAAPLALSGFGILAALGWRRKKQIHA